MREVLGRESKEIREQDIVEIMERCPTLGAFGFGCFGQYHPEYPSNNAEELKRDRQQLRNSVDQCRRACEWLAEVEKARSINRRHSSYGIKHQSGIATRFTVPTAHSSQPRSSWASGGTKLGRVLTLISSRVRSTDCWT